MSRCHTYWGSSLIILWSAIAHPSAAEPLSANPTLSDLQDAARRGALTAGASAASDYADAEYERQRALAGAKLFGSAAFSDVSEPVTNDIIRDYQRTAVRGGIRYPLMGSRAAERRRISDAQEQAVTSEQQRGQAERDAVALVTSLYVQLWAADAREAASKRFLAQEDRIATILEGRVREGVTTAGDAARLSSSFDESRNLSTVFQGQSAVLRERIREITGLVVGDQVAPPSLEGGVCLDAGAVAQQAQEHDLELQALEERMGIRKEGTGSSLLSQIGSSVELGYGVVRDNPGNRAGHGMTALLNVEVPLDVLSAHRQAVRASDARIREVGGRRNARLGEIVQDAEEKTRRVRTLDVLRRSRTQEAERARGQLERLASVGRLEEVLEWRHRAYQAELERIQVESEWMVASEAIRRIAPRPCGVASAVEEPRPRLKTPEPSREGALMEDEGRRNRRDRGVYIWQLDDFLAAQGPEEARRRGINRLLLGLEDKHIDGISRSTGADGPLVAAVVAAQRRGSRVDALLGDPRWITPTGRGSLLAIIGSVKTVPFNAIQLDLEPNQLSGSVRVQSQLLRELVQTLKAVRARTDQSLVLSIHPMFFEESRYGFDLAEELKKIRRLEVALMMYASNPERTLQVVEPILQKHPEIGFFVSQSVEQQLSPQESLFHQGERALMGTMRTLEGRLARQRNFRGILLQDWRGLEELQRRDRVSKHDGMAYGDEQ